jgi:hypothetical protein
MDVVVTEALLVPELTRFLVALDYVVERVGPTRIRTLPPDAVAERNAGPELDLYLLVWCALHLDADACRVS